MKATNSDNCQNESTIIKQKPMKITLPLVCMTEGLRRGCAAALPQEGHAGIVKLTFTQSGICIESEHDKNRVIHTLPVTKPVSVVGDGTYLFEGGLLHKMFKTLKPSSRHMISLDIISANIPKERLVTTHRCGTLKWVALEDGAKICDGAIPLYRPNERKVVPSSSNPPMTHTPLLELHMSDAKQIIAELMATKTESGNGVISLRDGSVKLVYVARSHSIERNITPSEYVAATTGKHDIGLSMDGIAILQAILSGISMNDKSSQFLRLSLADNGMLHICEIGNTQLHLPVIPALPVPPFNGMGYLAFGKHTEIPSLSFAVEADMLTKRLAHAVRSIHSSEANASIIDGGTILHVRYCPNKEYFYPGEAKLPCHSLAGNIDVSFSFNPKLVYSFAKTNEGSKISFEVMSHNGKTVLRLRSSSNHKLVMTMKMMNDTLTSPAP